MIWYRVLMWIVFLLLLFCPIITAEGDEKVIVEDFDDIYYMEDTGSVEISTKITFVGDNYTNGYVPIEVTFYIIDWKILSEEDVNSNKVRTHVDVDRYGNPIYEYHNYTATFGFETNLTGDLEFRLMVHLGNIQGCNEVYTIHIDPGYSPESVRESFFRSILIFIIITLLVIVILVIRKPLIRSYRSHVSAKIDEKKNQHDQEVQDLRTMIRIAYKKGGITEEEMGIFDRQRKQLGLSEKDLNEMLKGIGKEPR